jgi:hypothetical protein
LKKGKKNIKKTKWRRRSCCNNRKWKKMMKNKMIRR